MHESTLEKLQKLLSHKKSKSYYADKLGITEQEVNELLKELRGNEETITEQANYIGELEDRIVHYEEDITNNKADITFHSKCEIKTLEELIEKTRIDTNVWKIDRYVQNFWGSNECPSFQVKAFLHKRELDKDINSQKDHLIEEIRNLQIAIPINTPTPASKGECLLEISIPDLHIGKLAHHAEVGEDYDIKIACSRWKEAVIDIVSRVNPKDVGKILLPIGNDLINVDNEALTTTAGTPQDCDSRFSKMIRVTKTLLIETIYELLAIAPVDVIVIPGNHDQVVTFMLGEIIDAFFANNLLVNVNNAPTWRKYYQFGSNGFLYTHGNNEKHQELGLIFATEQPQLWADTKFRVAKLGHFHKAKTIQYTALDSHQGFQVQVLPSLSSTDYWHSSKGYLSNKQARGYLYHPVKGEIAQYTFSI